MIQNDFALAKVFGASTKAPVKVNGGAGVPTDDEFLTVMGWGVTVEGVSSTQSDVLREVDVQYMTNTECDTSNGVYEGDFVSYEGYIEDNMMCAWSQSADACQGDSGGPLILKGSTTGEDVQVGVVSWGLGCAMATFPGVYSRISAEFDWIQSTVCSMSASPPDYFNCPDRNGVVASSLRADITVAMELDGNPEETSWVFEENQETDQVTRGAYVDGTSFVPFGTYKFKPEETVWEGLKVVPNQSYRMTMLDKKGDGVLPRSDGQTSKFRVCYGAMSGAACLADSGGSVVCEGTAAFSLSKSISCFVEDRTPSPSVAPPVSTPKLPTFAPFFVPLFFETRQPLVSELCLIKFVIGAEDERVSHSVSCCSTKATRVSIAYGSLDHGTSRYNDSIC